MEWEDGRGLAAGPLRTDARLAAPLPEFIYPIKGRALCTCVKKKRRASPPLLWPCQRERESTHRFSLLLLLPALLPPSLARSHVADDGNLDAGVVVVVVVAVVAVLPVFHDDDDGSNGFCLRLRRRLAGCGARGGRGGVLFWGTRFRRPTKHPVCTTTWMDGVAEVCNDNKLSGVGGHCLRAEFAETLTVHLLAGPELVFLCAASKKPPPTFAPGLLKVSRKF